MIFCYKINVILSVTVSYCISFLIFIFCLQDEAGAAALKTVELDAALGGRAVQYREVQGHETERFLSYFKPCIIPQEGGIASGFKHVESEEHKIRMFTCQGKHVVHVKEASLCSSSY